MGYAVHMQVLDRRCVVVLPNCYFTGFEADLLGVTADGRCIDIEVKISRQDLRADYRKDKWWQRPWGESRRNFVGPPSPPRPWPRGVWKHYYAMPAAIWTPELVESIPPNSGILLLDDSKRIRVERRARPNRAAKPVSTDQAMKLAHLCSLRMWDALNSLDRTLEEHRANRDQV